ncbi:MAG: hypothetical protein MJD61_09095, partial [Proteobacteria bacterium]|nr:hypothetical protein [Pseudomonadota bacterium]
MLFLLEVSPLPTSSCFTVSIGLACLTIVQPAVVTAQDTGPETDTDATEERALAKGRAARPSEPAPPAGDEAATEEIMVRGIRGSLRRSMDVKRQAGSIVDAIAAEDLGKFPEQNVAESLQRIA